MSAMKAETIVFVLISVATLILIGGLVWPRPTFYIEDEDAEEQRTPRGSEDYRDS